MARAEHSAKCLKRWPRRPQAVGGGGGAAGQAARALRVCGPAAAVGHPGGGDTAPPRRRTRRPHRQGRQQRGPGRQQRGAVAGQQSGRAAAPGARGRGRAPRAGLRCHACRACSAGRRGRGYRLHARRAAACHAASWAFACARRAAGGWGSAAHRVIGFAVSALSACAWRQVPSECGAVGVCSHASKACS